jgi:uncharacterized protein
VQFPDARILIFAKTPREGEVKTRLAPLLGARAAAAFHSACLQWTVQRRVDAAVAPVVLYVAPDLDHPLLRSLANRLPIELRLQRGADLGERMRHAAAECLGEADKVLLSGCDAPCQSPGDLIQALNALQSPHDVTMQPAEDGGYLLLGLRQVAAGLFERIPWGGDRVAAITRQRCRAAGLSLYELLPGWDVDRPADLLRLAGSAGLPDALTGWSVERWLAWLQARCSTLAEA